MAARLMTENREVFRQRWAPSLDVLPHADQDPPFSFTSLPPERLLVVDDRVPNRDRGSGDPRMALLLRELRTCWPEMAVTFLARDATRARHYGVDLADRGIEVVWGVADLQTWFRSRRGLYSTVLVSRPVNFVLMADLIDETQPQALRVYDAESLFFRRLEQQLVVATEADRDAWQLELKRTRLDEVAAMCWADVVLAVSDDTAEVARSIAPAKPVFVIGHGVDLHRRVPDFDERRDAIFYGGFMAGPGGPNEDAVVIAVDEVLPALRRMVPDVELRIVGADPTPTVEALASAYVDVVGQVTEPWQQLSRARVHLSPLRFGAGLKLRFVDTMAAGLPFVTTSVGAQDLGLDERLTRLLVHDHPRRQAELAADLYEDRALWTEVSQSLHALATARFSPEAFRESLLVAGVDMGFVPPAPLRTRQRAG